MVVAIPLWFLAVLLVAVLNLHTAAAQAGDELDAELVFEILPPINAEGKTALESAQVLFVRPWSCAPPLSVILCMHVSIWLTHSA